MLLSNVLSPLFPIFLSAIDIDIHSHCVVFVETYILEIICINHLVQKRSISKQNRNRQSINLFMSILSFSLFQKKLQMLILNCFKVKTILLVLCQMITFLILVKDNSCHFFMHILPKWQIGKWHFCVKENLHMKEHRRLQCFATSF